MIDTHCHLSFTDTKNLEEVIKRMEKNIIIVSGADVASSREAILLAEKYPNIYATIGFHPEEAGKITDGDFQFLEENLVHPKVVGVGEIGLDYYYTKENKEAQKELFIRQLELARKYHKSVVIHSREAIADTYEVIAANRDLKYDIHCFSGSPEMAEKFVRLGCRLGIGGVVTFKNGKRLQEVVASIPLASLLLETDSPYLTPEPYRGEENQPYNILFVAQKIAEIKGISVEEVLKITTLNSISQFDLKCEIC